MGENEWEVLFGEVQNPKADYQALRRLSKVLGKPGTGPKENLVRWLKEAITEKNEQRARMSPEVREARRALFKSSQEDKSDVTDEKPEEKEVSRMAPNEKKRPDWLLIGILGTVVALLVIAVFILVMILRTGSVLPQATYTPLPTYTPYPTITPTTSGEQETAVSSVDDEPVVCRLDKIGTWSEVQNAELQRIEIGGHGTQHVDYYPDRGVKTISYIVPAISPPEVPDIWWGFGSIWEGQLPMCQHFNWIADATGYAEARLDSGHSGVVIDLRGPGPKIVANVAGLSQKEIDDLRDAHRQGMQGELPSVTVTEPVVVVAEAPPAAVAAQPGCPQADDRTYGSPTDVSVIGPAIVHPWWNNGVPSFEQAQVRVLLRAGESATFLQMMGKSYTYEDVAACRANLDDEFTNANFPVKTVGELRSEGLVR